MYPHLWLFFFTKFWKLHNFYIHSCWHSYKGWLYIIYHFFHLSIYWQYQIRKHVEQWQIIYINAVGFETHIDRYVLIKMLFIHLVYENEHKITAEIMQNFLSVRVFVRCYNVKYFRRLYHEPALKLWQCKQNVRMQFIMRPRYKCNLVTPCNHWYPFSYNRDECYVPTYFVEFYINFEFSQLFLDLSICTNI